MNSTKARTRNPEWFIGGPLHGQDKLSHPSLRCVNQSALVLSEFDEEPEIAYELHRFAIGRTLLTIWVYRGVGELEVGSLLAELLLAPHQVAGD